MFDTSTHIDYYLYVQKLQATTNNISLCTGCFKSLGIDSRMAIYSYLKTAENASVKDITLQVGLRQPTISHHLHEMQKQGLLKSEKKGKEVLYSLNYFCPHFNRECILKGINL